MAEAKVLLHEGVGSFLARTQEREGKSALRVSGGRLSIASLSPRLLLYLSWFLLSSWAPRQYISRQNPGAPGFRSRLRLRLRRCFIVLKLTFIITRIHIRDNQNRRALEGGTVQPVKTNPQDKGGTKTDRYFRAPYIYR